MMFVGPMLRGGAVGLRDVESLGEAALMVLLIRRRLQHEAIRSIIRCDNLYPAV